MALDVDALYRRYGPMVLRRCRSILRDEELAYDAMHDTFVQLLRHQRRLADAAPSSLLYRIATNVCLNKLRTARRHPEDREHEVLMRIAASEALEQRSVARSTLDRLFGNELASTQSIAVMLLVDGMTLEEVAREVDMSVSGIRKRMRVLRAHLQELEAVL